MTETPPRRGVLYLVAFLSGFACLGLEVMAPMVINPISGNSEFVWGATLSVFLLALSLGYWLGGRIADRTRGLGPLLWALLVLAPLVAAVVPLKRAIYDYFYDRHVRMDRALEPVLVAGILFFLPTILFGVVSPFLARRLADAGGAVGGTVGKLFMVSTLGSVLGALFPSFVLQRYLRLGVPAILFSLTGALLATAGLVLLEIGRARARRAAAAPAPSMPRALPLLLAAIALLPGAGAAAGRGATHSDRVVLEKDSFYHHIVVRDIDGKRYLIFGNDERRQTYQSGMLLSDPNRSALNYTDHFHFAFAFAPDARRVALVGLGGGSTAKEFIHHYPGIDVQVVEIDAEVIRIAREHFQVPDDPRLHIENEDGRRFFRATDARYDVIVVDAYYHSSLPFHLLTQEYYALLKEHLTDRGIVVVNLIAALEGTGRGRELLHSVLRTLETSFPTVYTMPVAARDEDPAKMEPERVRNLILFATRDAKRRTASEFEAAVRAGVEGKRIADLPGLTEKMKTLLPDRLVPAIGQVLTDDNAPVNHMVPIP